MRVLRRIVMSGVGLALSFTAGAASAGDKPSLELIWVNDSGVGNVTPERTPASYCFNNEIPPGLGWHGGLPSCDGRFLLYMQDDGNFVVYDFLYGYGRPMQASGTWGTLSYWAVNQTDGNFVLYTADGHPTYWSGTWGQTTVASVGAGYFAIYRWYPYPPLVQLWYLPFL